MAAFSQPAYNNNDVVETPPNIWNGTMFSDLDWPLNVSYGLLVIAEFLVAICLQRLLPVPYKWLTDLSVFI